MRRSLFAGGVVSVLLALLVVVFTVSGGIAHVLGTGGTPHTVRTSSYVRPQRTQRLVRSPAHPIQLANEINRAEQVIENRASPRRAVARAGLVEELAGGALSRERPRARHTTLSLLRPQASATVRTDIAASAALSRITVPEERFPPWTIAQPPRPGTLLGYFREAQTRFGIGWQYLAAIEFIETRFGRIHGRSTAGAQGPMQFMPGTWATYGRGSINNQRDAIMAAARFLVASGARSDMPAALYHYNNSTGYVAAVRDYARRMRADLQAFVGYYNWQVIFARRAGLFILPVGYPRVRPEPVHYP